MDDHAPNWRTNGAAVLSQFGLTNTNVVRLNLFLPHCGEMFPPALPTLELASGLVDNYSLAELELNHCEIDTAGAAALAQAVSVNKYLKSLGLGRNKFYTEGGIQLADALKVNQTLMTLDLGWNRLRAPFAGVLSESLRVNASLQALLLDRNPIGDDGLYLIAGALQHNKHLLYLGLSDTGLGAGAGNILGQLLAANKRLKSLDISYNGLTEEALLDLFSTVHNNPSALCAPLVCLNLCCNKVGRAAVGLALALQKFSSIQELNLRYSRLRVSPDGLGVLCPALASCAKLRSLDLSRNPDLGDCGIKELCNALCRAQELQYLDLSEDAITADSLEHILRLVVTVPVAVLHLSGNTLSHSKVDSSGTCTNGTAEEIGKLLGEIVSQGQALRYLGLNSCSLNGVHLAALSSSWVSSRVRAITLRGNGLGCTGVEKFLTACMKRKNLEYLDLSKNDLAVASGSALLPLLRGVIENNESLPYIVIEDTLVYDKSVMKTEWEKLRCSGAPPIVTHPIPPLCRCKLLGEPSLSQGPSAGFASHSVTQGTLYSRHNENASLLAGTFNWSGRPVKHCWCYSGERCSVVPNLELKNGVYLDNVMSPETVTVFEESLNGMHVTDDTLRRDFNMIAGDDGLVEVDKIWEIYRRMDHIGLSENDAKNELDTELWRLTKKTKKIGFDQFCVVMLKLVNH